MCTTNHAELATSHSTHVIVSLPTSATASAAIFLSKPMATSSPITPPPPADDGDWLVRGSNTGNWGNAGLLVPSADSASRLVDFLLSTWRDRGAAHVDWVLQRDFVRAGGEVQHASPPLFGWRAGESDILGKHRAAKRCRDA